MALLLALPLASCAAAPAIKPGGIVSSNPCIDAILAEIATPGQIAAVSIYSQNPDSASAPLDWARKLPAIGTSAEEIIAAQPRLVLTGNLASSGANAALAKVGIKTVAVGVPVSVEDSKKQVMQIADAIGRHDAGEDLARRIEEAISPPFQGRGRGWVRAEGERAALTTHPNPSLGREGLPSAIIWQNGDFVPGKGTLQDELLGRAGFTNASALYGLGGWDVLPLEVLIRKPPQVIFMPVAAKGEDARNLATRKKLLKHLGGKVRIVPFPDKLLFCGGPTIIKVMDIFHKARREVS